MTLDERMAVAETRIHTLAEEACDERARAEVTRLDVETRLRRLERNLYFAMGALGLLQVVLKFVRL